MSATVNRSLFLVLFSDDGHARSGSIHLIVKGVEVSEHPVVEGAHGQALSHVEEVGCIGGFGVDGSEQVVLELDLLVHVVPRHGGRNTGGSGVGEHLPVAEPVVTGVTAVEVGCL